MRDTLREPTASLRSEDPHDESQTLSPIYIPGFRPVLSTASSAICQENGWLRLPIREPIITKVGNAAYIACTSHRKTGGSTVSVFDGNLAGRKLFSLSVFPDRTVELYDPPTWREIFVFALGNSDLVLRKGCAIGTWYDRRRRLHVLDVVVCVANLQAALELASCFDQQSVYNLQQHMEILVPYRPSVSDLRGVEGGNG